MIKTKGFKCNKCRDILYTNRKCSCGSLAYITSDKFHIVYSDDEDFEVLDVYISENKLVRVAHSFDYDLGATLYLADNIVNDII